MVLLYVCFILLGLEVCMYVCGGACVHVFVYMTGFIWSKKVAYVSDMLHVCMISWLM